MLAKIPSMYFSNKKYVITYLHNDEYMSIDLIKKSNKRNVVSLK